MKILIACYSGTGNTLLACEYIAAKLTEAGNEVAVHNIVRDATPSFDGYDMAGFACFTDFWGPPRLMELAFEELPWQKGMPAFVFATYGYSPGRTPRGLADIASARGFRVVAAHGLHVPENYPPMITRGRGAENAPKDRELANFQRFVDDLVALAKTIESGRLAPVVNPGVSLPARLVRFRRTHARKDMGDKSVDEELCTECGICAKKCPYGAITLDPRPVFDMEKCWGCWACFHHCPTKAIYTAKFRGKGHYPEPLEQLRQKLQH